MSGETKQISKSAIKNFAIEARKILMKSAETEAGLYGISADEIRKPIQVGADFEVYETLAGTEKRIFRTDMRRRKNLVAAIQEKGFQEVIEETAYTWFNRLIAIRFMEVNDYLPTRTRVLSSETGNNTPDLINEFLDVDLGMTEEEMQAVQTAKNENRYDDAFRLLFVKECNALHDVLPGLFKKTDDYMELLLNLPYTSDGVVRMLIDTIPEENFDVEKEGQIEIIGWLYQYYNTEPKAKAFSKKKEKITKEEIPAVTQLFTPDWIVRYMVENSLGRLWIEGHPDEDLKSNWKYYLDEAQQEPAVEQQLAEIRKEYQKLTPEDIKVIDPCMGSGHILVYLFEVLMQIYKQDGYTERDAAELILEKNLYGLDIDDRAYQLSYFAVMMKARQYNRNIFRKHPKCHIYAVQESNAVNRAHLNYFGKDLSEAEKSNARKQMEGLLSTFVDGKEYGSILKVEDYDWDLLRRFIASDATDGQINFETMGIDKTKEQLEELIDIGKVMAQKYWITCTNPPYMGSSNMSPKLYDYIMAYYASYKSDLFAAFILKVNELTEKNGLYSLITQQAWMFKSSYRTLRPEIYKNIIVNMLHLGSRAFDEISGEVVQTVTFTQIKAICENYKGSYLSLEKGKSELEKQTLFLNGKKGKAYISKTKNFLELPGEPTAYWATEKQAECFRKYAPLSNCGITACAGLNTSDNNRFLRMWHEVYISKIGFNCSSQKELVESGRKYALFNKGGGFRKWYGNQIFVIKFDDVNYNALSQIGNHLPSRQYYFMPCLTWNRISSANDFSVRECGNGYAFDDVSPSAFMDPQLMKYAIGVMNSKTFKTLLCVLNRGMKTETGNVQNVPFIFDKGASESVTQISECNVLYAKADWDSYETSWDFKVHPLVQNCHGTDNEVGLEQAYIEDAYNEWEFDCNERFNQLKANEEELNRIFIDIYGLQDELTPEVEDKDITVHRIFDTKDDVPESLKGSSYVRTMRDEIVSLISYAIGCMFGRYSLDKEGLAYAGGEWDESLYQTFQPDADAIIPITDEEYGFDDDIVTRFIDFVRTVYGEETLEENLEFIAKALGNKGSSYREVLRNYFVNDFYKDHCATYSVTGSGKRPIYWLFDSGKQNGFKALIYMHRYTSDTVGLIRSVYLQKVQTAIETAKQNAEYIISTSSSATEKAAASRKRDKYVKQLNELRPYYQALTHVALQRIDMDLDNGVKANYQLFQNVEISTEGKKQKIDLLAKI